MNVVESQGEFVPMTHPLPNLHTMAEVLRWRAQHQPDQTAFTFLVDGKVDELISITYADIDLGARTIGAQLQKANLSGSCALLFYQPGLEFITAFFGCLYAGVIAVPAPPPDTRLQQSLPRLQAIVNDSKATAVLTSADILTQLADLKAQLPEFQAVLQFATDQIGVDGRTEWQMPAIGVDDLAYLQYTSGSTSTPKGVMISHGNLMHHSACVHQAWGYTADSISATWLPYFHDYGLVDGLMQPIYAGFPAYLLAPMSFVKHPFRWLQTISHFRITHTQAPNFAYDYCVRRVTPEERAVLDLSCLRSAGNGSEPVRETTMTRFIEAFAPQGFPPQAFCPAYGLAEATLVVSSKPPLTLPRSLSLQAEALENRQVKPIQPQANGRVQTLVSCGPPVANMRVIIANTETKTACTSGEVGEIWVCDPSVAQGYWQHPQATQETFHAYLADTGAGPFLRTGDLGFLHEGELYITGRLKDMIIIHGQNYYPQDVEMTVEKCHPALKQNLSAAFSVEAGGEEQLVVAIEVERRAQREANTDEIIEKIREMIWHYYGLKVYAIALLRSGTIPRTSSGKIQRHACRQAFLAGDLETLDVWWRSPETSPETAVPPAAERAPQTASQTHHTLHNPLYNGAARRTVHLSPLASPETTAAANGHNKADDLITWLRHYANERINSRIIDERRTITPHVLLDFGNHGVLGLQVPVAYGGLGLNNSDALRVFQQLGGIDLTLATFVIVNDILGTRPIINYGTPATRQELLPIIAAGRELAAFAYTEPVAGSNPRGIATTAVPDGSGGWLLNGQKSWIGAAAWAGVINVFAQQYDDAHNPIGISGFVVRQGAKGLSHGPEALTTGMRGLIQNSVFFHDVQVTPDNLLGKAGAGMEAVALDAMMYTRLVMAAVSVGSMKRAFQLMHRYASRRTIATGRLLDNPVSLARFSDLTAAATAVEALVTMTGQLLDAGYNVPEEAFVACKTSGPEFLWETVNTLIQMLGGRGYIETNIAPQLMRDARIFRIFEGPTETLNMYLGSRVMNKDENINRLLGDYLQVPHLAAQLQKAATQIQARCVGPQAPFVDQSVAARWAHSLVGELTTTALLAAAAQALARQTGTSQLTRAVTWATHRFEQQWHQAINGSLAEHVLVEASAITEMVSTYAESIGDLEQTFAGEDHELDAMLRRDTAATPTARPVAAAVTEPVIKPAAPPATPNNTAVTSTSHTLLNWINEWLQGKLRLAPTAIQPDKSFAEYGLDSVTAVELAMDLEAWLHYPLEATIVWNFPTPETLAGHLANEAPNPTQTTNGSRKNGRQTPMPPSHPTPGADLDDLTEAELAALLAAEMRSTSKEK